MTTQTQSGYKAARAAHLQLGETGEDIACRLLRDFGMEILVRNYAGPNGELDVVARDGEVLSFVEVKTRRRTPRSRPVDAVTSGKKKRIIRTAQRYIRKLGNPDLLYRYDVVEVVFNDGDLADVRYWPNAFSEEAEKARRKVKQPPL
jgi:putative endonuclease